MNIIRIARSVSQLSGIGTEYLVDGDNNVLYKFIDGNAPVCITRITCDDEPTHAVQHEA